MIMPTIHMNGTSAGDLMRQAVDALEVLRIAKTALAHTCPNGRDYYPQGPHAIVCALAEHRVRMGGIEKTIADLEALATHIDRNRNGR